LYSLKPTRENKIKFIENELYRRSMEDDIPTKDLIKIHEDLVWSDNQQKAIDFKNENSFNSRLNDFLYLIFSVMALATISSYLGVQVCGDNRSYFCKSMHHIPNAIERIFQEPKSKVLPLG
jgi:hypothetical protein